MVHRKTSGCGEFLQQKNSEPCFAPLGSLQGSAPQGRRSDPLKTICSEQPFYAHHTKQPLIVTFKAQPQMHIPLKKNQKIRVLSSLDIYRVMLEVWQLGDENDRHKEHFWTMALDNGNNVLNIELVSLGSSKETIVEPTEVFGIPLQKQATKLVLIHNHPAGSLTPSDGDKDVTDRLIQVGIIMKLPVLDHIIVTESGYYSFADTGLLKELSRSLKYVPGYMLRKRIEENAREDGKEERDKQIAKTMLAEGYTVQEIAKLTGLSAKELEQLR
jgi:DNA repair protein RadC